MLFSIDSAAMNGGEDRYNALDQILARVEFDIHEIEIADADLLQESAWYESCRPDRRSGSPLPQGRNLIRRSRRQRFGSAQREDSIDQILPGRHRLREARLGRANS